MSLWLLPILIHSLACLLVVVDLVSSPMTTRSRVSWLAAVVLVPGLGAAAYGLLRRPDSNDNGGAGGDGGAESD